MIKLQDILKEFRPPGKISGETADEKEYLDIFKKKYGEKDTDQFLDIDVEPLAGRGDFKYNDILKLAKKYKFSAWDAVRLVDYTFVNKVMGVPMSVKNESINEAQAEYSLDAYKIADSFTPSELRRLKVDGKISGEIYNGAIELQRSWKNSHPTMTIGHGAYRKEMAKQLKAGTGPNLR